MSAAAIPVAAAAGLATQEAKTMLAKSGSNAMPDIALHPVEGR